MRFLLSQWVILTSSCCLRELSHRHSALQSLHYLHGLKGNFNTSNESSGIGSCLKLFHWHFPSIVVSLPVPKTSANLDSKCIEEIACWHIQPLIKIIMKTLFKFAPKNKWPLVDSSSAFGPANCVRLFLFFCSWLFKGTQNLKCLIFSH